MNTGLEISSIKTVGDINNDFQNTKLEIESLEASLKNVVDKKKESSIKKEIRVKKQFIKMLNEASSYLKSNPRAEYISNQLKVSKGIVQECSKRIKAEKIRWAELNRKMPAYVQADIKAQLKFKINQSRVVFF